MALVNDSSIEATTSNLDLFSVPATQTAILKSQCIDYYPVAELSNPLSPIEFVIASGGDEYTSLKDTLLYIKAKIVKADGTALKAENKVAFVNLPLQSLFSQVDVSFNQKLVSSTSNLYPFQSYLIKTLNYGKEAKSSQLTSELYYKDTAGVMNNLDTKAGGNAGLLLRNSYTEQSKSVDLCGSLCIDVFQTDRLLLNGVEV